MKYTSVYCNVHDTIVGVCCFQVNENVICLHLKPASKNCAEGFAL